MQQRSSGVKKSKSGPIAPTTYFSIHPVRHPIAAPAANIGTSGHTSDARIFPRRHQHRQQNCRRQCGRHRFAQQRRGEQGKTQRIPADSHPGVAVGFPNPPAPARMQIGPQRQKIEQSAEHIFAFRRPRDRFHLDRMDRENRSRPRTRPAHSAAPAVATAESRRPGAAECYPGDIPAAAGPRGDIRSRRSCASVDNIAARPSAARSRFFPIPRACEAERCPRYTDRRPRRIHFSAPGNKRRA